MRSSAIAAMLLVVVTQAAIAEPPPATAQPARPENSGRIRYGDPRHPAKVAPRPPPQAWIELATPTPAKHGTEFIVVGKEQGDFAHLRIDAVQGKVIVNRIRVYFVDGKVKTVDLASRLDEKRRPMALVDLGAPRPIDHVVITTETYTNGTYALYGSSAAGAGVAAR